MSAFHHCFSVLYIYFTQAYKHTHTHTHTQAHTYTQAHTHGNMMTALPPSEKWQMLHLWCQALVSEGQLIHLYAAVRRSWRLSGGGDSPRMEAWFSFFFFEWSGSWSVGGVAVEGVVRLVNPILNHQGSQHSDILENHICTRGGGMHATHTHTHTHTLYTLSSHPTHTHTHWKTLKTSREGNWIVHVLLFERCSALARPPSTVMV